MKPDLIRADITILLLLAVVNGAASVFQYRNGKRWKLLGISALVFAVLVPCDVSSDYGWSSVRKTMLNQTRDLSTSQYKTKVVDS